MKKIILFLAVLLVAFALEARAARQDEFKRFDTFGSFTMRNGVTEEQLKEWNPELLNPHGQLLLRKVKGKRLYVENPGTSSSGSVSSSAPVSRETQKVARAKKPRRQGIILEEVLGGENIKSFAKRNCMDANQLVRLNPEISRKRIDLSPFQLREGEMLRVISCPESTSTPTESSRESAIMAPGSTAVVSSVPEVKIPVDSSSDEDSWKPDLGWGIGLGNSKNSDFVFSGLYLGLPITKWLSGTVGMSIFKATDKEYLAGEDTWRGDLGLCFKVNHFVTEVKVGGDYNNRLGLSKGPNLSGNIQGGYWRFWNTAEAFTNVEEWPFWTRDRLKFSYYQGETHLLSVGGEYNAYGWKDMSRPQDGYYYTLRGGGFLMDELVVRDHPMSVLIGVGATRPKQNVNDLKDTYYIQGELTIKLF